MDFRIVGSGLEGFPLSGLVGWPADQAAERPPPHDLLASWPYPRYLMGLWHVWLPLGAVGARRFGALWRAVAPCGGLSRPIGCPYIKSLEPSMPGGLRLRCPDATLAGLAGWLAWLAGLAGWLGWLAAAGGLLLAGCCWLMEGSLTRSTLWGGRRICGIFWKS